MFHAFLTREEETVDMRRLFLPLALSVLLAGPAHAANKGAIDIASTLGPITPVCAAEIPCNGPAEGVRIVVVQRGLTVARAITNQRGRVRISIVPGRYLVTASYGACSRLRAESVSVRVTSGRISHVRFAFDTGIR